MDYICHSFRRNRASGLALRNVVAPLFRQRELAVVVFLGFFCGSVAGALLFAPHNQPERMGLVAPKAIAGASERPAQPCSPNVNVTSAHAIDFDRDTAQALNTGQRQFLQQQLSASQAALLLTRAKTSAVLARAAALKDLASHDSELQVTQITKRDDATLLADLKNTLLALQLKHREMLTKYVPTYPLVQEVAAQIADAQSTIRDAQQSPIQEVTAAKSPRQDWIATELAKTQVDQSEFEAEAATDYRLVKHYEESLQHLDLSRTLAFEQGSTKDAKSSCDVLLTSNSQGEATDAAPPHTGSRATVSFGQNPVFGGETSAVHWWPVNAFVMAALAGILAAFLTDSFRALFRGPA